MALTSANPNMNHNLFENYGGMGRPFNPNIDHDLFAHNWLTPTPVDRDSRPKFSENAQVIEDPDSTIMSPNIVDDNRGMTILINPDRTRTPGVDNERKLTTLKPLHLRFKATTYIWICL